MELLDTRNKSSTYYDGSVIRSGKKRQLSTKTLPYCRVGYASPPLLSHTISGKPRRLGITPPLKEVTVIEPHIRTLGDSAIFKLPKIFNSSHSDISGTSDRVAEVNEFWRVLGQSEGERGKGIKLAIVDDSIDTTHADFEYNLVKSCDFADTLKVCMETYGLFDLRRTGAYLQQLRNGRVKEPYYRILASVVNALLGFERYPSYQLSRVNTYAYYYASSLNTDFMNAIKNFMTADRNKIDIDALFHAYGLSSFEYRGRTVYFRELLERTPPREGLSHGTHVASIACGGSSARACGVAPDASLFDFRVGNNFLYSGSLYCIEDALAYCIILSVDVVNLSLGSSGEDTAQSACVTDLLAKGTIICAATGNSQQSEDRRNLDTKDIISYPSRVRGVISVGAADTTSDPKCPSVAAFSERGARIECLAPGVDILAAEVGTQNGYISKSGTSMATPYTSGLMALLVNVLGERRRDSDTARRILWALAKQTTLVSPNVREDDSLRFSNTEGYGMLTIIDRNRFLLDYDSCPSEFKMD